MNEINLFLQKSLSISLLITYTIFRLIGKIVNDILGLNDISGWPIQLRASGLDTILEISVITFFFIYLALDIRKSNRNISFSKIHLISVAICTVINNLGNIEGKIYFSAVVCCILIFVINIYLCIFSKKIK